MGSFSEQTIIDAPRERVWEVLAEIGSIERWNPGVKRSFATSPKPGGEGATRHCDLQRASGRPAGHLEERAFDWRELEGFRIEITESSLMTELSTSLDVLTRLRLKGIGLSIDDFGTGYSSLSALQQFPISTLKNIATTWAIRSRAGTGSL